MAQLGAGIGGYGRTTQTSWLGQSESQYDPLRDLQGRLAKEQWEFQKQAYQDQLRASRASRGAFDRLVNQYNLAYGQARMANEARYKQLLGIADQTTGQRAADIRSDYAGRESDVLQNLARLGASNTTIAPTLQLGIERERQSALNRLADEMQGTKLGIIERREDKYPDPNVLVALAQQIGQGGGTGAAGSLGGMTLGGSPQFNLGPTRTSPR